MGEIDGVWVVGASAKKGCSETAKGMVADEVITKARQGEEGAAICLFCWWRAGGTLWWTDTAQT